MSREFGFDRGTPIDRFYIERFLSQHRHCIRGSTLEIGTNMYTTLFGSDTVTSSHVLHVAEERPEVTMVGDLTSEPPPFPDEVFDCAIVTQTLQFVFDLSTAVFNLGRMLRPGGALLVTVPGVAPISSYDMERWGEYWRFTSRSVEELFAQTLPGFETHVEGHGNVLAATAFLYGIAAEELSERELLHVDAAYQVILCCVAKKPSRSPARGRHESYRAEDSSRPGRID